ncbi:MAG: D-alanine--D-alanine ligase family protein [Spirochaetota bacterium]|nr:D-alanine--D-alanine ligase family protein [Spirochaetota bacterium]
MVKVGILYGGRSQEHDVSRCSAASVISAIDKSRYEVVAVGIDRDGKWYVQESPNIVHDEDFGSLLSLEKTGKWLINHYEDNNKLKLYNINDNKCVELDIVFPVIHGTFCEDGTLQGLLELSMVPFIGADVLGSAIAMDKDIAKRLLRDNSIPVVPWITFTKSDWDNKSSDIVRNIFYELDLPVFIKPCCAGSSVGVVKVKEKGNLENAIEYAFKIDDRILVEKAIDGREIECSVLGNYNAEASILGEVIPQHEYYSYEAKYIDPDGARLIIPADVDNALADEIRQTAIEACNILRCNGMARVDFFLENNSSAYYLNEINTLPGFTSISMYPKLWENTGLKYSDLLDRLIDLAFESHRERLRISSL